MNAEPTNVNHAYRCESCETDMPVGNITSHLAGKKHRNRCAVLAALEESRPHTPPAPNPVTISPTGYCGFCKGSFTDEIEKHMTSTRHVSAVKRATQAIHEPTAAPPIPAVSFPASPIPVDSFQSPPIPADSFHCAICNRTRKLSGYDLHLESEFHRNAVLLLKPSPVAIEPPAPLTMLVVEWFCEICESHCHINTREEHLASKKHVKKARLVDAARTLREMLTPVVVDSGAGRELAPAAAAVPVTEWFCEICEKHCHISTREAHLGSKKHIKKAGGTPHIPVPAIVEDPIPATMLVSDWFCEICEKDYHINTREAHLGSKKHIKKASGAPLMPVPAIVEDYIPPPMLVSDWFCEICEKDYHTNTREAHLGSKKHAKKAKLTHAAQKLREMLTPVGMPPVDLPHGEETPSTDPLTEKPLAQEARTQDGDCVSYCDVCGKKIKFTLGSWNVSPGIYCGICQMMVHADCLDAHLARASHLKSQSRDATTVGVRVTTPSVAEDTPDANYCVPCERQFKDISPHLLSKVHLRKLASHQLPPGKLYCDVCNQEYGKAMEKMHRTPAWDCELCDTRTHTGFRSLHEESEAHVLRVAAGQQAAGEDHVQEATAEELKPDDQAYCAHCDQTPKSMAKHLKNKTHRALKQKAIEDGESVDGKKGSEGAAGEEEGGDVGDFDKLNLLVRRRALEKGSSEVSAESDAEIEIWSCTLCMMDMHPTMRKAHKAHPYHMLLLEQEKLEVGDPMQTTRPRPDPTNPRVPLFRCHICIATYSPSERYLHTTPPWHCEVCDTIVHASSKANHLSSVRHRLKESAPGQSYRAPAFTPASTDTFFCLPCRGNFLKSDRKFHYSPPYYCALCGLVMHADTRDIHEWSLSHSRAVAAATTRPAKSSERFGCQTCGDTFPIAVQPFHRSRAWTCELCEERVHMDWIGAHLLSKKHMAREKNEEAKGEEILGGRRGDGPGVGPVKHGRKKRGQAAKVEGTGKIREDN